MDVVVSQGFSITLIASGILAPIVEELTFRYCICKMCGCSIFISALIFGIAHMNLVQSTYAFIIGLVLGKIYTEDFNLLKPILVHIAINSSSIIFEYSNKEMRILEIILIIICSVRVFILERRPYEKQRSHFLVLYHNKNYNDREG
jgi:membrane protease YdiL (CAAX protease family)